MSIDDTPHADGRHQSSAEFVQIPIILRRSQLHMMNHTGAECGFKSHAELFFAALSLFTWALQEVKRGRRIASYDEETDNVEMVHIPALANFDAFAPPARTFTGGTVVKLPWWKRLIKGA